MALCCLDKTILKHFSICFYLGGRKTNFFLHVFTYAVSQYIARYSSLWKYFTYTNWNQTATINVFLVCFSFHGVLYANDIFECLLFFKKTATSFPKCKKTWKNDKGILPFWVKKSHFHEILLFFSCCIYIESTKWNKQCQTWLRFALQEVCENNVFLKITSLVKFFHKLTTHFFISNQVAKG